MLKGGILLKLPLSHFRGGTVGGHYLHSVLRRGTLLFLTWELREYILELINRRCHQPSKRLERRLVGCPWMRPVLLCQYKCTG